MPGGGDPVEDHAAEPEQLVIGAEAVHERGDGLAHGADVDHQDDRGAQRPEIWAVDSLSVRPASPSNRPIVPSTTAMSGAAGAVGEERADALGADHARVEVAPGRPAASPGRRRRRGRGRS